MATLKYLRLNNYRSIGDQISIRVPTGKPLVLVGPNNAGKSNILLGLDLLLGERSNWNYRPEENEHFERSRDNRILVSCDVDGMTSTNRNGQVFDIGTIEWSHPSAEGALSYRAFRPDGDHVFTFNDEARHQCTCVLVHADRRLGYELTYTNQFTLLSRLMRRFHDALKTDPDRMQELETVFARTRDLFGGVPEFAEFTTSLQAQLNDLTGPMDYRLEVDFSAYDPRNYFQALRVQAKQGNEIRSLQELGTGQEQMLALSLAQAYAEAFHSEGGLVLALEEPESHLHPLQQRWLATRIRAITAAGMQTVLTTHSPEFLDVDDLEGIVLVRKVDGATQVKQLTASALAEFCRAKGANAATAANILPFYKAAATLDILSGLFATRIVLVEGSTEALALPILWSRVGLDTVRDGIAVIAVHGVGNIARWWRFFSAYGIPTYPVFDNDANDDGDGSRRLDLLRSLGVPEDEIPVLTSAQEWIVMPSFAILGPDFESAMRRSFADYEQLEASAVQEGLRGAKPLVARYAAERVEIQPDVDGGAYLLDMADAVTALTLTA